MSRIRSVHPGLFTDEAWVSCSPIARLFVIGLWTDADDQGVFEWKPLQLKMRLLPGDTANAAELLDEIQRAGIVTAYEVEGKRYGAIKNFRRFQRPQKPNALHPLPETIALYVGISATAPKSVEDYSSIGTIEAQPMEDGGGVREEELEASLPAATDVATVPRKAKSKPAKPKPAVPAWLTDPDFCAAWDACTPQMRKRSDGREKTYAHWKRQVPLCGSGPDLVHALKAYCKGDDDVKRTGGPGLHVWLSDGRWDHWTTSGTGAAPTTRAVWSGPPEIRNAVIRETSSDFAGSYLDPCAWTGEAILPRNGYAADKLRRLHALQNVSILEPIGAAA